jgi:hypothetical protein
MSDLENSVRATVGAMVHDISVTLDVETQSAISRWITKTAMVWRQQFLSRRGFIVGTTVGSYASEQFPSEA